MTAGRLAVGRWSFSLRVGGEMCCPRSRLAGERVRCKCERAVRIGRAGFFVCFEGQERVDWGKV